MSQVSKKDYLKNYLQKLSKAAIGLGGFAGGVAIKKSLLALEHAAGKCIE